MVWWERGRDTAPRETFLLDLHPTPFFVPSCTTLEPFHTPLEPSHSILCALCPYALLLALQAPTPEHPELHSVSGPMARNVQDLALFMDALAGQHPK
jgi:hypothetical protein